MVVTFSTVRKLETLEQLQNSFDRGRRFFRTVFVLGFVPMAVMGGDKKNEHEAKESKLKECKKKRKQENDWKE